MQNHFGDNYDVDCEYNKNLSDIKTIHVLKSELEKIYKFKNKNFKILKNEFTISVYPDIIVHKRNTNDNLLIVEVKKKPSNIYKIKYDFIKLKHYTKKTGKSGIGYEYGAFICFDTGQYPKIKWFQNGKKLK
jgi:zona occludens toxin (predicted ATPase)